MEDTHTVKSGRILHLIPVKQQVIRTIMIRMGLMGVEQVDDLLQKTGADLQRAIEASEQLYNYCAGWGVTDDPDSRELAEIDDLGFDVERPHIARAHWLRLFVLRDDEETSALIAAVLAHSVRTWRGPMRPPQEQGEVEQLKARLAELEAQQVEVDGS